MPWRQSSAWCFRRRASIKIHYALRLQADCPVLGFMELADGGRFAIYFFYLFLAGAALAILIRRVIWKLSMSITANFTR